LDKEILQSIDGVSLYPIISLIIFFLFFAGLLIWIIKADKTYLNKMEKLPIDCDVDNQLQTEKGGKI